ncbi:MAG TPA: Na(+)/H(+) antiporter subunit B [Bacillota bacterium]|nr:Na(+)/H(+) antiporter subunit B [Bacillota bacterium]
MKTNDVILHMVTKIVVFIILTLAIYLFIVGHNQPGGGFIAGLVLSSAFVLLYLAHDIETIDQGLPLNFRIVAAIGVFLAVGTGLGACIFGQTFLTQTFISRDVFLLGEITFTTVTLFEGGVALTVVGVVVTIILSISEDV